jgi:hypothetical protein
VSFKAQDTSFKAQDMSFCLKERSFHLKDASFYLKDSEKGKKSLSKDYFEIFFLTRNNCWAYDVWHTE